MGLVSWGEWVKMVYQEAVVIVVVSETSLGRRGQEMGKLVSEKKGELDD
jgi:hypothetical protein